VNLFATTTGAVVTLGGQAVNIGASGSATTIDGTLTASEAVTCTTDLTVSGGDIDVSAVATTLKFKTGEASGLVIQDSAGTAVDFLTLDSSTPAVKVHQDIVGPAANTAVNLFATTTGAVVTLGGQAVNIGASGSATTIDGTLTASEAVTLVGDQTLGGATGTYAIGRATASGAGGATTITGQAGAGGTDAGGDVTITAGAGQGDGSRWRHHCGSWSVRHGDGWHGDDQERGDLGADRGVGEQHVDV